MNKSLQERRHLKNKIFKNICVAITVFSILILIVLLYHIMSAGFSWLSWDFLTNYQSRKPHLAGIKSALFGTLWLISITAAFAIPMGVATAIYLEEYAEDNTWNQWIKINIGNLAGMPSIVYGLVGLTIFVRFLGFDRSLLAGGLTLGLLVLPVIVISSQESIRAVPRSIREAAFALGARKWQVVFMQVLPAAIPGIMTGIILSISRAMGESAPLILVGAVSYAAFVPKSVMDPFAALPMQIFNWASRPQESFHGLAAAGIIVLLLVLFVMNSGAIYIRQKFQKYK